MKTVQDIEYNSTPLLFTFNRFFARMQTGVGHTDVHGRPQQMHDVRGKLHRPDGDQRHADGGHVVANSAVHTRLGVRSHRGAVQHHCNGGEWMITGPVAT